MEGVSWKLNWVGNVWSAIPNLIFIANTFNFTPLEVPSVKCLELMSTIVNKPFLSKQGKKFIFNTCYPCPMLVLSLLYSASSFLGRTILHQFSLILEIWCRYCIMFDVGDGIYQASFVINFHFVNIFKWKKSNEAGWRVVWFSFLACDILILILDSARLSFRPASPGTRSQCFIRAGEMVFLFPAPVGDSIIQ